MSALRIQRFPSWATEIGVPWLMTLRGHHCRPRLGGLAKFRWNEVQSGKFTQVRPCVAARAPCEGEFCAHALGFIFDG